VTGKSREPAWIARLEAAGTAAKQARDVRQRRLGSQGAAGEGKRLTAWSCLCGWSGSPKELKLEPKTAALLCPSCGHSEGLQAKQNG
jgi:hypothetical protein